MKKVNTESLIALLVVDSRKENELFPLVERERPACLLPLCNMTLLEHALFQLDRGGVSDILVGVIDDSVSSALVIRNFLNESLRSPRIRSRVTLLGGGTRSFASVGEILRDIDTNEDLRPKGEFVVVNVFSVFRVNFARIAEEHRYRHEKDPSWTSTCLFFKRHRGENKATFSGEVLVGIDEETKQLLLYRNLDECGTYVTVSDLSWSGRDHLQLIRDIVDCCCDILSPEVLTEFRENFDYEELRDYMKNKLDSDSNEISGNKSFFLDIADRGEYCRQLHGIASYYQVVRDFVHGWLGDPDLLANYERRCPPFRRIATRGPGAKLLAEISRHTAVFDSGESFAAEDAVVSVDSRVTDCIISGGVHISEQCVLENVVILDGCVIEKGCVVRDAIVGRNTRIMQGSRIDGGCVIGPDVVLPECTHIREGRAVFKASRDSLRVGEEVGVVEPENETTNGSTNTEDVFGGLDEAETPTFSFGCSSNTGNETKHIGVTDAHNKLTYSTEQRFSHDRKSLFETVGGVGDDFESIASSSPESESMNSFADECSSLSPTGFVRQTNTDQAFTSELVDTVLRALHNDSSVDDTAVELSSLRLAYDQTPEDISGNVVLTLAKESLTRASYSGSQSVSLLHTYLNRWKTLIQRFASSKEAQMQILDCSASFSTTHQVPKNFFSYVVQMLYEADIVTETTITEWTGRGEGFIAARLGIPEAAAGELLTELGPFLKWLSEAEEED